VLSNTVLLNMLGKKRVYGFLLDNLVSQTMLDFTSEVRAVQPRRRAVFFTGGGGGVDAGKTLTGSTSRGLMTIDPFSSLLGSA